MDNTKQSPIVSNMALVYWTDPAHRMSDEHSSGFYVVDACLNVGEDERHTIDESELVDVTYRLVGQGASEVYATHGEIRLASEQERFELYAAGKGEYCKYCLRADGIEGGFVEVVSGTAKQNVFCACCDSEWQDTYVLSAD